ncbi:MAG: hypothetical protein JNN19_05055, partial [Bacteroidia bacterium]|nr:hypothetical protein [Bacteroidia bacterium]
RTFQVGLGTLAEDSAFLLQAARVFPELRSATFEQVDQFSSFGGVSVRKGIQGIATAGKDQEVS